jgi:beta-1,4-mannosyltransferase
MKVFIPNLDKSGYVKQKVKELKKYDIHVEVHQESIFLNLYKIFTSKIIHLQWPEHIAYNKTTLFKWKIIFYLYKLMGGKIIWTIHNITPHDENKKKIYGKILDIIIPNLDGWIGLSRQNIELICQNKNLKKIPHFHIPHGDFKNLYPNSISKQEAKDRLRVPLNSKIYLYFGTIYEYKNVPELINEFLKIQDKNSILIIAGKTYKDELRNKIQTIIQNNKRILFFNEWIPDSEVQSYFNAADVTVIPYGDSLNSGVAFLSLSFNKPICCPNTPTFIELKEEVGSKWIHLYEGAFNHEAFEKCLKDMPNAEDKPDLSKFEWSLIALKLADFYKKTLNYTPNFK